MAIRALVSSVVITNLSIRSAPEGLEREETGGDVDEAEDEAVTEAAAEAAAELVCMVDSSNISCCVLAFLKACEL
jgi:hypothetical protein